MVFAKLGPNYANIFHWQEWCYREHGRVGDFSKYFDPAADWPASCLTAQSSVSFNAGSPTQLWRASRSSPKSMPYYSIDEGCLYAVLFRQRHWKQRRKAVLQEGWRDDGESQKVAAAAAADGCPLAVTPSGTITLRMRERVRVDLTLDRAVRIINPKNNIVICLNGNGSATALLHPNGRVYQYGSRVEILAHDATGNNKFAKMWYKGVSFTSDQCALVYLVDAAGTRTTTDNFCNMVHDFSIPVFYNDSRHGPSYLQEAISSLHPTLHWVSDKGIENWVINSVKVSQTEDGLVRVERSNGKYQLRTSPSNGTASLTTPFLHCTASLGQTSHLFVRRGERRMHYDGVNFIVRNAGHSAGFDDKNQLKVY